MYHFLCKVFEIIFGIIVYKPKTIFEIEANTYYLNPLTEAKTPAIQKCVLSL